MVDVTVRPAQSTIEVEGRQVHDLGGEVAIFGPMPPTLTGAAACTGGILRALTDRGLRTRAYPLRGLAGGSITRALIRVTDTARRASDLWLRPPLAAYFSLEGNSGKALSIPLIALCTRKNIPVFIHHHSYSYIGANDPLIRILLHAAPDATHIFQCSEMSAKFAERYVGSGRLDVLNLTNAFLVDGSGPTPSASKVDALVLGFMSGSHAIEKGLWEAATAAAALATRTPVALHVAGPLSADLREDLERRAERGAFALRLYGVVTDEKSRFFSGLDVFLFPTRYRHETQGIVNLEAMAYGVPVVAIGQCCVEDAVAPFGGLVFNSVDEFTASAPDAILSLAKRATLDPRRQFDEQLARSCAELSAIVTRIAAAAVRQQ